jgi:hypothetical protein
MKCVTRSNTHLLPRLAAAGLLAAAVAGCSGAAAPPSSSASPGAASGAPSIAVPSDTAAGPSGSPVGSLRPLPSLPPGIATVPPPASGVTGEVPASILDAARSDLRGRIGAAADGAAVVVGQEVVWSDGSLGCPVRGQAYTQALVPGFWIVLEAAGERYDYRASRAGAVRLCEGVRPLASG